jgi:hypothetical protein
MIVSIHQPHFFPWLGYLHRMMHCDLFVLLDHVQFERQNYQNRVTIKTPSGPQWLSVPVLQRARSERIVDKRINNDAQGRHRWGARMLRTLQHAYRGAPWFQTWAGPVERLLNGNWERLLELDVASLDLLRGALNIDTPLLLSSTLNVRSQRAEAVLEICQAVGAKAFLGGMGGSRHYLDAAPFRRAGIELRWQEFEHPRYAQRAPMNQFLTGVSALDLIFNCGPESRAVLGNGAGDAR